MGGHECCDPTGVAGSLCPLRSPTQYPMLSRTNAALTTTTITITAARVACTRNALRNTYVAMRPPPRPRSNATTATTTVTATTATHLTSALLGHSSGTAQPAQQNT